MGSEDGRESPRRQLSGKAINDFSDKERPHSLKKGRKSGSIGKRNQKAFGSSLPPAS